MAKLGRWLKRCDSEHADCSAGLSGERVGTMTALPTRLVDVGLAGTPMCRLAVTQGMVGRYAALSHRWGGKTPLKTMRANLDQHKQEIPLGRLPQTFQDAIRLTRQLGLGYIWIDSLCIVQDSRQDWAQESQRMGAIYEGAYVTMAATSGTDGDAGIFASAGNAIDYVKLPCDAQVPELGHMYFSRPVPLTQSLHQDDAGVRLEQSPLNQRGWVFQERALSRRLLHFMSSQVYWECQHGMTCQSAIADDWQGIRSWHGRFQIPLARVTLRDAPALVLDLDDVHPNHVLMVGGTTPGQQRRHETATDAEPEPDEKKYSAGAQWHLAFHQAWEQAMCYYSTRALTVAHDRLAALQGIVERLEHRTGFGCLAGHWCDSEACFIKSLAWAVHRPAVVVVRPGNEAAAAATAAAAVSPRAPSWSWLAQERHIYYPQVSSYLRAPWMHAAWSTFGRSDDGGMHIVAPLPKPGCFTRALEFRMLVSARLAEGLRGEPLPDDIPWAVSTPAENYAFAVSVGFYRSGDHTAWPDPADQRSFTLLTPAASSSVPQAVIGWVRFDDMTPRPRSFTCCPMYVSSAAVACLVLAAQPGHAQKYNRVGLAMVCRWQRTCTQEGPNKMLEIETALVASWLNTKRQVFELA